MFTLHGGWMQETKKVMHAAHTLLIRGAGGGHTSAFRIGHYHFRERNTGRRAVFDASVGGIPTEKLHELTGAGHRIPGGRSLVLHK